MRGPANLGFGPTTQMGGEETLGRGVKTQPVLRFGKAVTFVLEQQVFIIAAPAPDHVSRLGIVASKKLGGSVVRNRAKRLIREMFRTETGTKMLNVPYRGGGGALNDMLAGTTHVMFPQLPAVLGMATSGAVKPLAVTTLKRSPALPDVPTVDEAGVPGFELPFWNGIFAPAATPRPILEKMAAACTKILREPAAIARGIRYAVRHGAQVIDLPLDPAAQAGATTLGGSPAERSTHTPPSRTNSRGPEVAEPSAA